MIRPLFAIAVAAVALSGQSLGLRITAQTLSRPTAQAMFGHMPKNIDIAAVQACNETASAITEPQSRVVQEIRLAQGMTILPTGAAISVVAAKQGSSAWQTFSRYGTAGLSVVSDLAALKVINPGAATGALIMSAATILGVGIRDLGPATQAHQNMVLASSMMPDPVQLPALGCTNTFYALVEADATARSFDITIQIPKETARQQ